MVSLAVLTMLLTGVSSLSMRLVRESRAQIAADAAALAGVIGGESAAQELALMNGATLCEFRSESIVSVQVCIGSTTARAFAREQQVEREEQVDDVPTLKP